MAHRLLAVCILLHCSSPVIGFIRNLPDCRGSGNMTRALRERFLLAHNTRRSQIGLGVAPSNTRSTPDYPLYKKASRMSILGYSCDLEKSAYARASQCLSLNLSSANVFVENNRRTFRTRRTLLQAAQEITQWWWAEKLKLRIPIDQVQRLYYTHLGINSFAKMASDLTTQVGCAIVHCGTSFSAVCHYKTGLANGRKLYETGPKCSACPGGKEKCYMGLCV